MRKGKQRKRRVVTRREYALHQGKKTTVALSGILILSMSGLAALMALGFFTSLFVTKKSDPLTITVCLGLGVVGAMFAWAYFDSGMKTLQDAINMEPVVPLTRHNTGDLPDDQTLVRASEEPPVQQADVLLRAAQGGQKTPEEQLLRPVDR